MFKQLRNRFLLMHMGIVSLLIAVFFGTVLFISYRTLEQTTDERVTLMMRARMIPQSIAIAGIDLYDSGVIAVVPSESDGNTAFFTRPARTGLSTRALPGIFIKTDEATQSIIQVESAYDMDDVFYKRITGAVFDAGKNTGKVRVDNITLKYRQQSADIVFVDITSETEFFLWMVRMFLFIALPLVGMIFLLSLFFANRSIRPIESSYNRQKEFIADASHELKTPLATISTNLDVLNASAEPAQLKWLDYIRSEVGRMAGLTNSLLYLAKMDYGAQEVSLPVDFGRLLTDIWLPLEAVLFEKGCDLNIQAADGIQVQGDADQLRKLLGILADNAVRYASAQINVKLIKTQNQAVMTITNDGSGIAPGDMNKIWERFYRCDPSRQYDGGFGLGLPMARAITERHKGRIMCESADGLTTFTVRLPLI